MTFDFTLIPTATLALMMLALGMELGAGDFARLLQAPRAALLGLGGQLLVLPGTAFIMALTLPLSPTTAIGIILLAACPGGATSNMFSRYARGDIALSIALTAVSSLAAPLTVPLIVGAGLWLLTGTEASIEVSLQEMIVTLLVTTALPVIAGMALLHYAPALARRIRGRLLAAATAVMVLLVIGLAVNTARVQPDVAGMFARSAFAVLLLMTICATMAALAARWAGVPGPQSRTLVLEVGVQNINLALVVAISLLGEPGYLGPTLVYLPFMLLFGGAVVTLGRRGHDRH